MRIALPSSTRRSSPSMLSPASPSGSSPGSPPSSPPHAHLHRSRRRSAHGFLSRLPSTARQHRWLLLSLLATAAWLALSRRTVPFFVLGSTYLLSSSYPTPVLGSPPDGFDLVNLKPAPGRTEEAVPRLIHQVRLGGLAMRPAWEEARASCLALHPAGEGWEFRLWEDAEGDAFVKAEYPDLFDLYRGYEQEIMRSNVLRYLVLHKYGGVYLDLDLRCRVKLDSFLTEEFITPPAQPIGVNNAFIVAKPNHPFFTYLIERLPRYHMSWFSSAYASNMFSTGCHFFSAMHLFSPAHDTLKVLPWDYRLNGKVTTPLFQHLGASSWHKGDAKFILNLGKTIEAYKPYLIPFAFVVLAVLGGMLSGILRLRRKVIRCFADWRATAAAVGSESESVKLDGESAIVGESTADEKRQLV